MHRSDVVQAVTRQRVVGIIRTDDAARAVELGERLLDAGLAVVEVSLTTPGALDAVAELAAAHPDQVVGAGTVLDAAAVRLAVQAGARLIVAPNFDPSVVEAAHRYGVAVVPGAATPTEALAAVTAGADLVKLFPASAYGPSAFGDVVKALPQVPFVPTGGIDLAEAPAWVRAGAVALGLGAALSDGSPDDVRDRVAGLLDALGQAR